MTKTQARLRCRQILQTSPVRVSDEDTLWLLTVIFPRHPDWETKQGCGVSHIEVRVTGAYKSRCFWIIRTDGTEVDISYKVSLDGRGTDQARVVSAARHEVFGQISSWKRDNPAPRPGMHCDHITPFDTIFKGWLDAIRLRPEEIQITSQMVGHVDLFLSRELGISWQRHHRQSAKYQWLDAAENIAKSNTNTDTWLADYAREEERMST